MDLRPKARSASFARGRHAAAACPAATDTLCNEDTRRSVAREVPATSRTSQTEAWQHDGCGFAKTGAAGKHEQPQRAFGRENPVYACLARKDRLLKRAPLSQKLKKRRSNACVKKSRKGHSRPQAFQHAHKGDSRGQRSGPTAKKARDSTEKGAGGVKREAETRKPKAGILGARKPRSPGPARGGRSRKS